MELKNLQNQFFSLKQEKTKLESDIKKEQNLFKNIALISPILTLLVTSLVTHTNTFPQISDYNSLSYNSLLIFQWFLNFAVASSIIVISCYCSYLITGWFGKKKLTKYNDKLSTYYNQFANNDKSVEKQTQFENSIIDLISNKKLDNIQLDIINNQEKEKSYGS